MDVIFRLGGDEFANVYDGNRLEQKVSRADFLSGFFRTSRQIDLAEMHGKKDRNEPGRMFL